MTLSITAAGLITTTLLATGNATYIADDLQLEVLRNRLQWRQVMLDPRAIGYCALTDADLLGELVIISWPTGYAGPYQVIDCGAEADRPYLQQIRLAVEVSESEWRNRANVGQAGGAWVTVYRAVEFAQKKPALPPVMRGMYETKALDPI